MPGDEPRDERDLLVEIGIPRDVEWPSAFDLLGVPEDCEDDALIQQRGRERAKPLKKWEQFRANPTIQKMATALKLRISDAQKKLRTADTRAVYRKDLLAERTVKFRQRITSAVTAGDELGAERVRQLVELAHAYRIDEATARNVIADLAHRQNPFAVLGLQRTAADQAWPTAYDLLLLDESESPSSDVPTRVSSQLWKIQAAVRAGKLTDEEASRLETYVQEAELTLSSPELSKAYFRGLQKQRLTRFQDMVRLALSGGGARDTAALVQLVYQGRQMRLSQETVEQVISRVAGVSLADAVGAAPVLSVNRSFLETYVRGDGQGSREVIGIRNDGTGTLDVHVETSHPWIQIPEPFFRTANRRDLTVTFPASRLRPGEKLRGRILIRSNGGDAEVEVTALLGRPGSEATSEQHLAAGKAYLMGLAFPFLLPFVILSWRFMMNRRDFPFLAFHAVQSMCCGLIWLAGLLAFGLLLPEPNTNASMALPCCGGLSLFAMWLGLPLGMWSLLKSGHNIQVPGLAGLIRRLL